MVLSELTLARSACPGSDERKWIALRFKAAVFSAYLEILTGLVLVVELLTPYRNFMMLALYWQYLQMRYMLDRDGHIKVRGVDFPR
jgi:hypothetical protein